LCPFVVCGFRLFVVRKLHMSLAFYPLGKKLPISFPTPQFLVAFTLSSDFMKLTTLGASHNGIIRYLFYHDCLISLSILLLLQMAEFPFFSKTEQYSICVYTTFSSVIYLGTDIGCFPIIAVVNNTAINMGLSISLWDPDFKFFGHPVYPVVGWLNDMIVLFSVFWATCILLPIILPFYIPTIPHKCSDFSTFSPTLTLFFWWHPC
jgi:hypothetical protein